MSEVILQYKNINKSFFHVPVLKNINLDIVKGHVVGLIGENGAGKTTLMNILGGVVYPDAGEMVLRGGSYKPSNPSDAIRHGIGFIHQELNLFTNLNIAENLFIDEFPRLKGLPLINRVEINAKTKEYLAMVDLDYQPTTLVERLSPGERQLVEIAKALSSNAEVIIFDEPTTSLTNRETERLFNIIRRLQESGKSIIYISHILGDVLHLADEIVVLRDGEMVGSGKKGDFTINKMISLMVGREINDLYPVRNSKPTEAPVLDVKNLSQAGIVNKINFTLHRGEILGLFGLMGSGRSEMARIIFGLDSYDEGEICIHGAAIGSYTPRVCIQKGVAFVTENRREEGLMMNSTIAENISLVSLPAYARSLMRVLDTKALVPQIQNIVQALQIKSGDVNKVPAKSLSGGNQQKTVLGKWLLSKPSILIVDEPTRGIDVGAKYEIYNILNELATQGTGVLFISSEIEELIGICDRILVMEYGETSGLFTRDEFNKETILRAAFRENGHGTETK